MELDSVMASQRALNVVIAKITVLKLRKIANRLVISNCKWSLNAQNLKALAQNNMSKFTTYIDKIYSQVTGGIKVRLPNMYGRQQPTMSEITVTW